MMHIAALIKEHHLLKRSNMIMIHILGFTQFLNGLMIDSM
jgi:hypothetical protein